MEVYVPTWNSGKTLDACLTAIEKTVPNPFITVIDRNSTDNTQAIAEKHGCHILSSDWNLGEARTQMMAHAKNDWFIMVDSDTYLGNNWFNEVWATKDHLSQADPYVGAVQGENIPTHGPYKSYVLHNRMNRQYPAKNVRRLLTCNVLLRREAFADFKTDAGVYEDWLMGQHLLEKGYSFYVAETRAYHEGPATMKTLLSHAKWCGAGMRLYHKIPLWKMLGALFINPLFRTPFGLKTLVFRLQWNWLLGWWNSSKFEELKR
jgi:glycosyltransferase involved in cell wall biosynthesis